MPRKSESSSKKKKDGPDHKVDALMVFGEEDFLVRERANEVFRQWTQPTAEGIEPEIEKVEGSVNSVSDAIQALNRVTEALLTFPFFSPVKVVWFQSVNFLGGDGVLGVSARVSQALKDFCAVLSQQDWSSTRLLISAGKVHKAKTFYKTLSKIGTVEPIITWSINDREWRSKAETLARAELSSRKLRMDPAAHAYLIETVGPNPAELVREIEKLEILQLQPANDDPTAANDSVIGLELAQQMIPLNRNARAFALGDALGERNLPLILKTLEDEWWSMRQDSKKSAIGLIYGLVKKIRVMLMVKEGIRLGWFQSRMSYGSFQSSFNKIPAGFLPEDKQFNLQANNPFVVFRAMQQSEAYTMRELIQALNLLLECNQALVSSAVDEKRALRDTLSRIAGFHTGP